MFSIVPEELLQSKTQQTLHAMHASKRKASQEVEDHLQRLQRLPHFAGAQHLAAFRVYLAASAALQAHLAASFWNVCPAACLWLG